MIRSIAFALAASVIAASCSGSPEALPTSTEQVVSTTAAATTTTETPSETTEELVERLGGAVVRLDVAACDGEYVGAGFLIDEHHIVTVAHNIVGAELIAATTGDEIAIAEPVGMDVLRDIALLRTDIPMGDVYFDLEGIEPIVGQDLILFGFPLGLDLTVTRGIVSNADVELPEEPLLRFVQIDAAANPGNSGGPVVTAEGDLIGILQSGIVGFEGLNFATKLTVVERLLNSWIGSPALPAVDCGALEEESASTGANTTEASTSKPTNTTAPTPISATPNTISDASPTTSSTTTTLPPFNYWVTSFTADSFSCGVGCITVHAEIAVGWDSNSPMPISAWWKHGFNEIGGSQNPRGLTDGGSLSWLSAHGLQFESVEACEEAMYTSHTANVVISYEGGSTSDVGTSFVISEGCS